MVYNTAVTSLHPEVTHLYREEYLAPIPEGERGNMMKAYHSRLNSSDEKISLPAAKAWAKWE